MNRRQPHDEWSITLAGVTLRPLHEAPLPRRRNMALQAEGDADRDAAPDCALMVRILRYNQQATA